MQQNYSSALLNRNKSSHFLNLEMIKTFSYDLVSELIDEVALGICFDVHKAAKLGYLFLDESKPDEYDNVSKLRHFIVNEKGLDVFGQVPLKKQYECICPNCQRNLAASRFAPHLEKCMGMGRNSSRIASKRIANSTVKNNMNDSDVEEYDNDADWNYYCNDNKKNKRKKEKNGTAISSGSVHNGHKKLNLKHTKTGIINKNGAFAILGSINEPGSVGSSASEGSVSMTYESMSIKEKRAMLLQMCGVISEHTKKMCTRSRRCPQHTEEQRKQIRYQLLGSPLNTSPDSSYYNLLNSTSSHNNELVDLGESLFEGEQSNELLLQDQIQCLFTPDSREVSPADSSSTNASTSSLSRKNESNSRSNKAKNGKKKLQQFVINSVSNMSSSSSVSSGINEHII